MGILARRALALVVQLHVRRTVWTERGRFVVDSQILLQLPATGQSLRFRLANGLGQHKGTHDAQQLDE